MRDDVRARRWEAAGDRGASSVQGRARLQIGGRARRGAHVEHAVHVRDAGGIKAQRLVERRKLPRVERRVFGAGRGCGPGGGRRRATAGHAVCRGELDCRYGAGHGEERTWNICCMVVTLEVSKLSGWSNADAPCRESKGGHAVRGERASREAAGGRLASAGHAACRGLRARLQSWGRARGGAHVEHEVHARDAGGIPV